MCNNFQEAPIDILQGHIHNSEVKIRKKMSGFTYDRSGVCWVYFSKDQCTVSIFGSKSGHFWTISQSANSLIPWPILKISEYFYVVNGIFSLKNAIEIIFRRF